METGETDMTRKTFKVAGVDVSKLPPELQKELKLGERTGGKRFRITKLLENAPEDGYTLNELLVLYYQRYNETIKRSSLQSHIGALVKDGEAQRVTAGRVKASDNGE